MPEQQAGSPLGKTSRCDPGMLPIMPSPHSKEQAAGATQTVSTEEKVARHTVPDCRGRTTDNKSKGWREWKGKKKKTNILSINTKERKPYVHVTSLQEW